MVQHKRKKFISTTKYSDKSLHNFSDEQITLKQNIHTKGYIFYQLFRQKATFFSYLGLSKNDDYS